MPKKSTAPFVVRWRNDVLNDPRVTKNGALSAMALTIYARVLDGKDCHPSAAQCAKKLRVGESTIERGWRELKELGWLEIRQTPESVRGAEGAVKVFRWPEKLASQAATPVAKATPEAEAKAKAEGWASLADYHAYCRKAGIDPEF